MVAIEELPDDVDALKRMIADLQEQHQTAIDELQSQQQAAIDEAVQAAVAAILRRYYGPRSEKFDPRQLLLFGLTVENAPLDAASVEDEAGEELQTRRIKKRHKHGRSPLPEHLERIEIEHDLDDKRCPACGDERCRIGAEISEQLEYFPASFKVLKHIRHKYACGKCDAEGYDPKIEAAAKPSQPIAKGLPGPSLLAHIITSKLGDHLPLYRLERIFERQKVHIARSTMCAWMRAAGDLVAPLTQLMTDRVRRSQVIHTDDTVVPIQSPGAKQCRKGRIWCYLGDAANPYAVYDYTPDRSRDGPAKWLDGYEGYLQADAYGGYDGIFHAQDVMEVACWAHARRKFYDAQDSDEERATQMLALIGQLYSIEREAKDADAAARLTMRQERSLPVLARIKTWLDAQAENDAVLPRSPMAKAITYAQNQWSALCTYATQGFLAIDNNASERALKRVAIGRKNWLFAGNDAAAANHARLWSLIASAERHGVDPQRYLTSVLAKLPFITQDNADELNQFLPDVWTRDDQAEPLPQ
jgi:transposase